MERIGIGLVIFYRNRNRHRNRSKNWYRPITNLNAYSDLLRNMKAAIFYNNEHTTIIISKLDITLEECKENLKHIQTTITHTLILEKTTKLLTPHFMIFIYQNKHYHVICVQN